MISLQPQNNQGIKSPYYAHLNYEVNCPMHSGEFKWLPPKPNSPPLWTWTFCPQLPKTPRRPVQLPPVMTATILQHHQVWPMPGQGLLGLLGSKQQSQEPEEHYKKGCWECRRKFRKAMKLDQNSQASNNNRMSWSLVGLKAKWIQREWLIWKRHLAGTVTASVCNTWPSPGNKGN